MDRDAQIEALYPLALAIARKVSCRYPRIDRDDIVSDASLGIILAVDHFDPSRGVPLRVYAAHKVHYTVFNGMRRRDPVSERVRRKLREAIQHQYEVAQELGRVPSFAELEQGMPGLREARIRLDRMGVQLLGEGAHNISDSRREPQRVFDEESTAAEVHEAMTKLSERQQAVLRQHYIDDRASLRTIGLRMRVSPQRISQLHMAALERLGRELQPARPA